jgi:branched-chain amino acid transport system ATP-binding protein
VLPRGLAYVPQGRIVFPQMTVLENLEMGGYAERDAGKLREALVRVHTLFPILKERSSQKAGTMSGGEQQMVAIGRGLMARPRLLLVDEPTLGLAPRVVTDILDVLRRINREQGVTVLFIEQNVELALSVAHRGYVLESGRLLLHGAADTLRASAEIRRVFLGL